MSGRYSRNKGHTFERTIAGEFRNIGFKRAKTSRQVSRIADDCKIDIVGVFPFAPQCKNMAKYASPTEVLKIEWERYVDSLDSYSGEPMKPMLLTKCNNKPVMATLLWEDLKQLIQIIYAV